MTSEAGDEETLLLCPPHRHPLRMKNLSPQFNRKCQILLQASVICLNFLTIF